jgi:glycosyltransferase involved in cell wall biosynthesis
MRNVDLMKGKYCVVIPAHDTARTIGALVREIKRQGLDLVVVDDGSRDRTATVAAEEGALVISHLRNEGKGRALRTAFEYAIRQGYEGVVTMDGDGQHDPLEIPRFIREGERQHAGLVIGNRLGNGETMPRLRRWANTAMSALISALARQRIPDSQCGFRFIRREVLQSVPLRTSHFEHEAELVFGAAARRWKIVSVPIRSIYRNERSHIRPVRDGLRFLRLLVASLIGRGRHGSTGSPPPHGAGAAGLTRDSRCASPGGDGHDPAPSVHPPAPRG